MILPMKLMAFFELIDIKNHLDIAIDTDKILRQNASVQPMPAPTYSNSQTLLATLLLETHDPNTKKNKLYSTISPKPNSISRIIGSYKSAVTKYANRLGLKCKWQSRLYYIIIKDDNALRRIKDYLNTIKKMGG